MGKHHEDVCLACALSHPAPFSALLSKSNFPVLWNVCFLFWQYWYPAASAATWTTFSELSVPFIVLLFFFPSHSPSSISVQVNWRKRTLSSVQLGTTKFLWQFVSGCPFSVAGFAWQLCGYWWHLLLLPFCTGDLNLKFIWLDLSLVSCPLNVVVCSTLSLCVWCLQIKVRYKLLTRKCNSLKCCFIIGATVSPLLFLFLGGFNLFAVECDKCYWEIIE